MLIINITFRGFYPHSKRSLFCALFWSNCAMLNCAIMNGYITSFLFAFTGPQQPLYQDERLIGDHRRPSVRSCLFDIVGQKAFLLVHKFWKLCSRAMVQSILLSCSNIQRWNKPQRSENMASKIRGKIQRQPGSINKDPSRSKPNRTINSPFSPTAQRV